MYIGIMILYVYFIFHTWCVGVRVLTGSSKSQVLGLVLDVKQHLKPHCATERRFRAPSTSLTEVWQRV